MKHFWLLLFGTLLFFTALYGMVVWIDIPILNDPTPWMSKHGLIAAALGIGLLVADILIPVPASLIMIYHGAVFGPLIGTLVSLIGGVAASLVGFGLGRRCVPLVKRLIPEDERARADAMLAKWGVLAIVVTRPVPLLSESVALIAGTTAMGWGRVFWASLGGILPAALVYALAGSMAAGLDNGYLVFGLVMVVAGLLWFAGKRLPVRNQDETAG